MVREGGREGGRERRGEEREEKREREEREREERRERKRERESITSIPFTGVVYFILNYYADKYNIYYVYKPAPYSGRQFLHRSAVNFIILGAVLLQLVMLFFSVIRLGDIIIPMCSRNLYNGTQYYEHLS